MCAAVGSGRRFNPLTETTTMKTTTKTAFAIKTNVKAGGLNSLNHNRARLAR